MQDHTNMKDLFSTKTYYKYLWQGWRFKQFKHQGLARTLLWVSTPGATPAFLFELERGMPWADELPSFWSTNDNNLGVHVHGKLSVSQTSGRKSWHWTHLVVGQNIEEGM